jgi:polysaccharide pyruvyl transferase WcaK-like protein
VDEPSNIRCIGLYGPFGWGNLGDASIQEAMMYNVRQRLPDVEFRGISLRPDNTREIHGIPSVPIKRTWRPASRAGSAGTKDTDPAPAGGASQTETAVGWKARVKAIPVLGPLLRGLWNLAHPLREVLDEVRFLGRSFSFLRSLDVFVLSGGGQLSDDWGGPWEHPYSILKWTVCARLAGCRVYVVSVGAGPFVRSPTPLLLRTAMRLAHYRSYRDRRSHDLVAAWGFTRRDPVYPDLAFSLPVDAFLRDDAGPEGRGDGPSPLPGAGEADPTGARPLVLGVSPMSYFLPRKGSWPDLDARRYERYRRMMAGFTAQALEHGDPVIFLCSGIGNDRQVFDDLVEDLGASGSGSGADLKAVMTRNLDHLLEQIAAVDILVTSRLHGVILSFLQGKPAIALSYDPKIEAVMETFGQSAYCLKIEEATSEELHARLRALRGELSAARERIRRVLAGSRAQLEEQYDRLFGPRPGTPGGPRAPETAMMESGRP